MQILKNVQIANFEKVWIANSEKWQKFEVLSSSDLPESWRTSLTLLNLTDRLKEVAKIIPTQKHYLLGKLQLYGKINGRPNSLSYENAKYHAMWNKQNLLVLDLLTYNPNTFCGIIVSTFYNWIYLIACLRLFLKHPYQTRIHIQIESCLFLKKPVKC